MASDTKKTKSGKVAMIMYSTLDRRERVDAEAERRGWSRTAMLDHMVGDWLDALEGEDLEPSDA